jgi:hypothetical protein
MNDTLVSYIYIYIYILEELFGGKHNIEISDISFN